MNRQSRLTQKLHQGAIDRYLDALCNRDHAFKGIMPEHLLQREVEDAERTLAAHGITPQQAIDSLG